MSAEKEADAILTGWKKFKKDYPTVPMGIQFENKRPMNYLKSLADAVARKDLSILCALHKVEGRVDMILREKTMDEFLKGHT